MDNPKHSFGRSTSMPLLSQLQLSPEQLQHRGLSREYETSQRALLNSPGFQQFRNEAARTWAPDRIQFSSPTLSTEGVRFERGGGSAVHSPSSDGTVKQAAGQRKDEGSSPKTSTSSSPDSEATITPERYDEREGIIPVALDESLADTAAFATQPSLQLTVYTSPSPWNPTVPEARSHSRASSGAGSAGTFVTDYSPTLSVTSEDSQGCMFRKHYPGPNDYSHEDYLPHTPIVTDDKFGTEDLHVPSQTSHHRRNSSRLSSLPAIPSPLGPGHNRNHLGSDVSGLVSPVPGPSGPPNYRQEPEAQKSPVVFGLHMREVDVDGIGSPFLRPTGFGHGRKHTDPFIDIPPAPSPRTAEPRQKFTPVSPYTSATPTFQRFDPGASRADLPPAPNAQPFVFPSPRVELPIPPPPLPSIQGKLNHTPEARARLDAQKAIRENWIRTEAKKIVELKQRCTAAAHKYQQTQSQEAYEIWQGAEVAFSDATNLEKRQEERRNLFLPQGTKAMRTGPDNLPGDASASYPILNGSTPGAGDSGQGEGRLLGFQMALMERVCAEVKQRQRATSQRRC